MAVNDVYSVVTKGTLYGVKCANVFHYQVQDQAATNAELRQIIADEFHAAVIDSELLNVLSEDFVFSCMEVRKIFPDPTGVPGVFFITDAGLVSGEALPASSCYKLRGYSTDFTKRGRGRKYFAGVPLSYQDKGNVIVNGGAGFPQLVTLAAALNADLDDAGGNELTPVIWSGTGETASDVSYYRASARIWSLKRRKTQLC